MPFGKLIRDGYLLRGQTLAELAGQIGADAKALEATVQTFNEPARRGEDPEFGKGSTSYNRSLGDPEHQPNPCLAPIETGPFYAVRLYVGDLGTFAGLRTNENAQVLGEDGRAIPGLYSAGNDAASIMGGNYPGGGHHAGSGDHVRLHRGAAHVRRECVTSVGLNLRLYPADDRVSAIGQRPTWRASLR